MPGMMFPPDPFEADPNRKEWFELNDRIIQLFRGKGATKNVLLYCFLPWLLIAGVIMLVA